MANIKVSELNETSTINDSDLLMLVQNNESKKINIENFGLKILDKNVITICSNGTQTINANTTTEIDLPLTNGVVGTKLIRNGNHIEIGNGVNHVVVSGIVNGNTNNRAWVQILVYRNNTIIGQSDALGWSPSDYYSTWSIAPKLFNVQEGDYVKMSILSKAEVTINQNLGNAHGTYLTVEVVD